MLESQPAQGTLQTRPRLPTSPVLTRASPFRVSWKN